MTLFDTNAKPVGEDIFLGGACKSGIWEANSQFDGSGDGTRVSGKRLWRFSRGVHGELAIEFQESGKTYYLPGIPVAESASSVSRFSEIQ